ncbi:MAG: C-terminal binding protein, partial [candidate division NC10 bacterium]|nr:C-terminal binding protein [candidate division NC10 bacterium]
MSRYTVVVVSLGYESYAIESETLRAVDAELVLAPRDCLTEDEVAAVARDADAILVREAPVSARVIDALTRCKAIVRYGVGVDNIDLEHARQRQIYVANIPGYGTEEVSDHAAALLLACIRRLRTRDDNL